MPEGPDGKTIIIVKKVSGHGGHHGGAWKVAYADFVTAMMALFMVLWLVNSASVTTREKIASFFKEPGVFSKGSGTPLELGGAGILPDAFNPPASEKDGNAPSRSSNDGDSACGTQTQGTNIGEGEGISKEVQKKIQEKLQEETKDLEGLAKELKKQILEAASKIGDGGKLLGKIDIKTDQRGLHIEIMDTDTASMFELGSSRLQPIAEEELGKIGKILKTLPNPLDIEGHTDGRPFNARGGLEYDNWNLSSDRAHSARRVLVGAGIKEKQIARVVGYADQRLKVPEDSLASANRRISISMRYTEMAAKALEGTKALPTEPRIVPSLLPIPQPIKLNPPVINVTTPKQVEPLTVPKAEALPSPSAKPARKELAIEVGVSKEEGPAVSRTAQPKAEPVAENENEIWKSKDKIFGNTNPFGG